MSAPAPSTLSVEERKAHARAWFGELRDRLCAEFEAIDLKPAELRLEAFHPMGTAYMSADGEGVCAADGSVHGTEGLYVADSSLFPTSVGVNPMMTIIAFSKRVSAELAEKLA